MSSTVQTGQNVIEPAQRPRLVFPALAPFYAAAKPVSYALIRIAFGAMIVTHGIPKLSGDAHGSMADPLAASTNLIGNVLHLPFASELATFVAYIETFGGAGIAVGFLTRILAPMVGIQMLFIIAALWPVYPWIDRGIEYPVMLGFTALLIAMHGGGRWSVDRVVGREV